MLFYSDTVDDLQRFLLRKNSCAGISLFHCIIPVHMIAFRLEINLAVLYLRFLKTYNICILFFQIREEIHFSHHSPQAVYIP